MADEVTVEYGDGVIEITINRPQALNALNGAASRGVSEALAELDASFSAADAFRYGLVNSLTAPGEALAGARALAARVTANGPLAVAATKLTSRSVSTWCLMRAMEAGEQLAARSRA